MSVRGFLTWYILAMVFVGAAGASVVQGLKWQREARLLAASERPSVSSVPPQDIAAADAAPGTSPPSAVPALRPPAPQRQHIALHSATPNPRPVAKRSVIAKAERPARRRPPALAWAAPVEAYHDYPNGTYAAPWQGYAAYPSSPPPPYPPYAYRPYAPYVPAYAGYRWPRPPYYSDF
jgi:hypothetical protein